MSVREIRFGLIGAGLMGREFAVAAARWGALAGLDVRPRVVAVADSSPTALSWFEREVPSARRCLDYRELLADPTVEAVYCALPHDLHERVYVDVLAAGKHLLGEKPFGIDAAANARIIAAAQAQPNLLVRCSSEFPFFPGAQRVIGLIRQRAFGRILEVRAGLLHSGDLDPQKPVNWKRQAARNGNYGCMGDLGMHVLHVPLRAGWIPQRVFALLSKVVTERPDGAGGLAPCDTWDNAVLATEVSHEAYTFPMLLETKRMSPGDTNTWYLRILGTRLSAEFDTKRPKTLRTLPFIAGSPQAWHEEDLGVVSAYPTITGGIFEFGFADALLQMWATFCDELAHGAGGMQQPFGCVTLEETAAQHAVLSAALESNARGAAVTVGWPSSP